MQDQLKIKTSEIVHQIYEQQKEKCGSTQFKVIHSVEHFLASPLAQTVDQDEYAEHFLITDGGSLFYFDYPLIVANSKVLPEETLNAQLTKAAIGKLDIAISKSKIGEKTANGTEVYQSAVVEGEFLGALTKHWDLGEKPNEFLYTTYEIYSDYNPAQIDISELLAYVKKKYADLSAHVMKTIDERKQGSLAKPTEAMVKNGLVQQVREKPKEENAKNDPNNNNNQDEDPDRPSQFGEEEKKEPVVQITGSLSLVEYFKVIQSQMKDKFVALLPLLRMDVEDARMVYALNHQYGLADVILGNTEAARKAVKELLEDGEKKEKVDPVALKPGENKETLSLKKVEMNELKDIREETGVDSPAARMMGSANDLELVMLVGNQPYYGENKAFINLYEEKPAENDDLYLVAPSKQMAAYAMSTEKTYKDFEKHLELNEPSRKKELKGNVMVKTQRISSGSSAMDQIAACNLISYKENRAKIGVNFNTFAANLMRGKDNTPMHTAILPPLVTFLSRGLPDVYKLAHAMTDPEFAQVFKNYFSEYDSKSNQQTEMRKEYDEIMIGWNDIRPKMLGLHVPRNGSVVLSQVMKANALMRKPEIWKTGLCATQLKLKAEFDKVASSDKSAYMSLQAEVSAYPCFSFMYRSVYDVLFSKHTTMVYSAIDFLRAGKIKIGDNFYRPKVSEDETKYVSVSQDIWKWYEGVEEQHTAILDFRCEDLVERIYPGQYSEKEGKKVSGEERTMMHIDALNPDRRAKAWENAKMKINAAQKKGVQLVGLLIPIENLIDAIQAYSLVSILPGPLPAYLSLAIVVALKAEDVATISHAALVGRYIELRGRKMVFMFRNARYGYEKMYREQQAVIRCAQFRPLYEEWVNVLKERYTDKSKVKTGIMIKKSYSKLLSKEDTAQKKLMILQLSRTSRTANTDSYWQDAAE